MLSNQCCRAGRHVYKSLGLLFDAYVVYLIMGFY